MYFLPICILFTTLHSFSEFSEVLGSLYSKMMDNKKFRWVLMVQRLVVQPLSGAQEGVPWAFFKTLLKGEKFKFDHHFAFSTIFLKR